MTRAVCLVLAVAAGLCAALLLASGPTVHYDGKSATCSGIIVSSEGGNGVNPDLGREYVRACENKQREWSVLAGLAALVCLGAGSVAHFSRRDGEPDALTSRVSHDPARG